MLQPGLSVAKLGAWHRQIGRPIPDYAALHPGYGRPTRPEKPVTAMKVSLFRVFLRNVNELRGRKSYINRKTYINKVHKGTSGRIGMIRATGRVDGAKP